MRLFFAVELPLDVRAALGRVRPEDGNRDYRWANPALMHVTLVFLGQQPAERLDVLRQVGHEAAGASQAGILKLGQPGSFGSRSAPRVLWIGLAGDLAALQALHSRLDIGLKSAGVVLLPERRPFNPHITLARRRAAARGGAPPTWPPPWRPAADEFTMDRLTLFESRLSPRGPNYLPLVEFPLAQHGGAARGA
ncbi:MAG: RNA 2',3'-cyclic phosphodiesterase [Chloroflexi bacterium]|nr:RNA 2',3'-cyclic phosphodiesterase [Chloroflexota bacterium]